MINIHLFSECHDTDTFIYLDMIDISNNNVLHTYLSLGCDKHWKNMHAIPLFKNDFSYLEIVKSQNQTTIN